MTGEAQRETGQPPAEGAPARECPRKSGMMN
jgi:hypothetical protein